jgi:hypothetical protein
LIEPVLLSKTKLGCVPAGLLAVRVKVEGDVTTMVSATPLVCRKPFAVIADSEVG